MSRSNHVAQEWQHSSDSATAEIVRLNALVDHLRNQHVAEWVRAVRTADVVPVAVEESLSWRLTRPVRMVQTAQRVLRSAGVNGLIAAVLVRARRALSRR